MDAAGERRVITAQELPLPGFSSLGCYRYRQAHDYLARHDHGPNMEICYLASGLQPYRVDDQDYILRGGTCYCTFPHESHSSGDEREQRGILYWLILNPSADNLLDLPSVQAAALGQALLSLPQRHFPAPRQARHLLDEVLAFKAADPDPLQRIRAAICLQSYACDIVAASNLAASSCHSPAIGRALDLIEREWYGTLPIALLAKTAGLSLASFRERFIREIGMPAGEWVMRRKLSRGQELLRQGQSVTATADRCGFSSSQYFATVFKRHIGQSPSAWLSANRNGNDSGP